MTSTTIANYMKTTKITTTTINNSITRLSVSFSAPPPLIFPTISSTRLPKHYEHVFLQHHCLFACSFVCLFVLICLRSFLVHKRKCLLHPNSPQNFGCCVFSLDFYRRSFDVCFSRFNPRSKKDAFSLSLPVSFSFVN